MFLVVAVVFGTVLAFTLPPLSGFDEHTHVYRIEQLTQLNIFSDYLGHSEGYDMSDPVAEKESEIYGGDINAGVYTFIENNVDRTHSMDERYTLPLSASSGDCSTDTSETKTAVFSNTAVNSPVAYAPQLVGYALARLITNSAYWPYVLARLCGYAFLVFACFRSIRRLPFGKWVMVMICLSPAFLTSGIVITSDTMANAVSLLLIANVLALAVRQGPEGVRRREWAELCLLTLAMAGVKATYMPLAFLPLLIPVANPAFRSRRVLCVLLSTLAATLVVFFAWYKIAVSPINTAAMWGRPEASPTRQVAYILAHPVECLVGAATAKDLSRLMQLHIWLFTIYRQSMAPYLVLESLIGVSYVLALVIRDKREIVPKHLVRRLPLVTAVLLLMALCCAILVALALYISYSNVGDRFGDGLQDRYYIPVAFTILLAAASLVYRLFETKPALRMAERHQTALKRIGGVCMALGTAIASYNALALVYHILMAYISW